MTTSNSFATWSSEPNVSLLALWLSDHIRGKKYFNLCSIYREHVGEDWEMVLQRDVFRYIESLLPEDSWEESIYKIDESVIDDKPLQKPPNIDRLILERWNGLRDTMLADCIDPKQEESILMFDEMLLNLCGDANDK